MRAPDFKKLSQFTIVEVSWADILEDNSGDPRTSHVCLRKTLGRVWNVKRVDGIYLLTLTYTVDTDGPHQSGWICIPISVIRKLRVIQEDPETKPEPQDEEEEPST